MLAEGHVLVGRRVWQDVTNAGGRFFVMLQEGVWQMRVVEQFSHHLAAAQFVSLCVYVEVLCMALPTTGARQMSIGAGRRHYVLGCIRSANIECGEHMLQKASMSTVRTLHMLHLRKHSRGHKWSGKCQKGCTQHPTGAEPYQL